ncbi:hypothetical protein CXF74_04775 [Psychromonas sp. Urea-02u-13]|nr:hypothetical protein CXF74_04775 [Psychromonas sp. Urea-02u-13]
MDVQREEPNGLGSGCLERQLVKWMQAGSINYHGLDRVTKLRAAQAALSFACNKIIPPQILNVSTFQ